ncbi:MAG: hypothetical protein SGILL_006669 [Bacillariaceae sp.]
MATPYRVWEGILEDGDINVVTIRPLESEPKFLGHNPDYDVPDDHPRKDMVYAKMQRSATLPKYHSEDRDFKCQPSKEYFKKLWDGTVELRWKEVWDRKDGLYLCVVADDMARNLISTLDPVPELQHDKYILSIRIFQRFSGLGLQPHHSVGDKPFTSLVYDNSPLKPFYHLSQLESLMFRVIHRFYREFACQLSFFYLSQLHAQLHIFYMRENQRFTESIDVDMIWADVVLFGENDTYENQVFPVLTLARSFQAKGKILESARLCEDVVDHWDHLNNKMADPKKAIHKTWVMKQAGESYQIAPNYAEAERCLVNAIWMECNQQERLGKHTSTWVFDEKSMEFMEPLVSLYSKYHIVHHVAQAGLLTYEEMPQLGDLDPRLFPILIALLDTAAQGTPASNQLYKEYSGNVSWCVQQVKNKFVASPKAARTAIKKAATSATPISVDQFRSNLYQYHNTTKAPFVLQVTNSSACLDQLNIKTTATPRIKKILREQVHRSSVEQADFAMQVAECCNCKGVFNRSIIKRCPCKEVEYCGTECQLAAWHAGHKLTCSAKKNKRSSTASTASGRTSM